MTTPISRRSFLGSALGAAALAACAGSSQTTQTTSRRVPLVDSHIHCFAGPNDLRFPYHPLATYQPEEAAPPERLLELMDATGVDYGIVVHPEPYQDDHRYLEYCLEVGQGRLKGVALVFAERPGSIDQLPDLVRRMPIVGIRIHAHQPDRLPPFGQPELYDLWKMASDLGIAVVLQFAPPYAPGFEPYIREFSETTVVIDHLGRPNLGTPEEYERVLSFARYPNTVVKYGSLPDPSVYPAEELQRVSDRVVSEWGTDRLIWGGVYDATSTVETYPTMRRRVEALLSNLSGEDLSKVLGGNAARLFGFEA